MSYDYLTVSRTRRRRPKRKRPFTKLLAVLLVLLLGYLAVRSTLLPVDAQKSAEIAVKIPKNASTAQIGTILKEKGAIRSARSFSLYARLNGLDGAMKPGDYKLNTSMSLSSVIHVLNKGPIDRVKITIPEGYTVAQIADLLEQQGLARQEGFLQALRGPWQLMFLQGVPVSQWGLEGYLFPDTYYLSTQSQPDKIAEMMLKNFGQVIADHDYIAQAEARGLTLHEAVTIASMVEREARVASERSRIAGVIFNRLKLGMPLQIDATVQYALGETKEQLLYKDLDVDSPYNTYKISGLPPGPIANPGWPSLEAAVKPESHNYLYYVAKPDGTHAFAETLAAHNANVAKYQ